MPHDDEHEPPVGLSVWEHDLYEHLTEHIENELALVDRYAALAESAGGHVAYLLKLVMEDEARHHRLFDEWRNALQSDAELREVPPQVPHLTRSAEAERSRTPPASSSRSSVPTSATCTIFRSRSRT